MPASSSVAARRIRLVARRLVFAAAGLIGLLASAAPSQAPESPSPPASHAPNSGLIRLLAAPENPYQGASREPTSQSGWKRFTTNVEPDAPSDEPMGGLTLRGTPINKRGIDDFPTVASNIFAQVDMQRGHDGSLHSIFDQSLAIPTPDKLKEWHEAILGQNTWMLWAEGDEDFWGWLHEHNYGITDFLVLLDSRQREHRFRDAGLVNQPGMMARTKPAQKILGLYLDQNQGDDGAAKPVPHACPAQLVECTHEKRYLEALSALASDGVNPDIYGYPSGVIGLRLFPNPDFFAATDAAIRARKYWQAQVEDQPDDDYYNPDSQIAADPQLVRPFRVGMTCAYCHVAPHPLNPPDNPEEPQWENISSTIGAQYWTATKTFANLQGPKSFFFQLFQSWQPGTLDASLLSTDHLNNPNTMNAVWDVPSRIARAKLNPPEVQSAENLLLPSLEDPGRNPRLTPRILIDGSDSVGMFAALSRVYLNIGTYYEQWIRLHNPVIGFRAQRPFEVATMREKSIYWRVAEAQRIPEIAAFFTYMNKAGETVTAPMKLASMPDVKIRSELAKEAPDAVLGRAVFIDNCAICHSSKQPDGFELSFSRAWETEQPPAAGALVLPMDFADWEAFKRSDAYLEYKIRVAKLAVPSPSSEDFFEHNYLSTDIRIPVTLVGTNSARAVATNAMKGQVWDNFSSETYKNLPAVGPVRFYNPYSGQPTDEWGNNDAYYPPAGGPGYYRPAPLVGIWATAPFLHNNALGLYTQDPSIKGRLAAFDDAANKLLSKAKRVPRADNRPGDLRFAHPELTGHDPGFIYRTTTRSWIDFPASFTRNLIVGIMGEGWTSFLTCYLWLALAVVSILLACIARQEHAGFTLLLFAVMVGSLLRLTGIDAIYPSLWWIPVLAAAVALLLWLGPRVRCIAPVFFALLAAAFLLFSAVATAWVDGKLGGVSIGPLPQGTPVNLIMNLDPEAPLGDLVDAASGLTRGLLSISKNRLPDTGGAALGVFEHEAGAALLKVSKCPDFVLDRGHWFAEGLSDAQKLQLKAFLKTL